MIQQFLLDNSTDVVFETVLSQLELKECEKYISDSGYFEFIKKTNGGFFFKGSLQIYKIGQEPDFCSIFKINSIIKNEYQNILNDEFFFAQEIFGNQFGFTGDGIIFFNIETGEKQLLAKNFNDWIGVLESDLEFLTGKNISEHLEALGMSLKLNERLCPKKPFVVGGEYEIANYYPQVFPEYIFSNANIANQVYNIPDGMPIKLKIEN